MNGLAICAGVGGLELGLKLALGDAYRCVCYIEREGYAASVLVARMEDKALDTAPVWDDLATFDGRPWRGIVDLISAGFPCQPASTAGRRKGTDDDRWLWPHIKRIVCEVRPRLIFLENVPGLLNVNHGRALAAILGDMAELGYDAEWDMFSAKGVGAPHLRKRVFILARMAERDGDGFHGAPLRLSGESGTHSTAASSESSRRNSRMADPKIGREESAQLGGRRSVIVSEGGNMADADDLRRKRPPQERELGGERPPLQSEGLPHWPPGPSDLDAWREILRRWPDIEPAVRRMADESSPRVDRLRALGNAVVPVVAAVAFLHLAERIGVD